MAFDTKSMITKTIYSNSLLLTHLLGDIAHQGQVFHEQHGQHGSGNGLDTLQQQVWKVESLLRSIKEMQQAKGYWPSNE